MKMQSKLILSKVISVCLIILLCINLFGFSVAVAATTKTVKATTQKELQKALKDDSITMITFSTSKKASFKIKKGNYKNIKLLIEAPNATIKNYGVFRSISTNAANFYEYATGNNITVTLKNAKVTVGKKAKVNKILYQYSKSNGKSFPYKDSKGRMRYQLIINDKNVNTKNYPFTYENSPNSGYYPIKDVLDYFGIASLGSADKTVLTARINGNIMKITANEAEMKYGTSILKAADSNVCPVLVDGVLYVPSFFLMNLTNNSIVDFTADRSAATLETDLKINTVTSSTDGLTAPSALESVLHDIALTEKILYEYKNNGKVSSITGDGGLTTVSAFYNANGSLNYAETNNSSIITFQYATPCIICDKNKCKDAATANTAYSSLKDKSYDFKSDLAGVRVDLCALFSSTTYEDFLLRINNPSVTKKMFEEYQSKLGYGQYGAVIFGKNSDGKMIGKYLFLNVGGFNSEGTTGIYYCIDKSSEQFGKSKTVSFSDCVK